MDLHETVLDASTHGALVELGPVMTGRGLYLGGGTAVALHLGHRRSLDLDWFSERRLPDIMVLVSDLEATGIDISVGSVERGTLHCRVKDVPVTVLEYPYPLLRNTTTSVGLGCRLASLEDLAAMKISAIAQRGSVKDFLDVYAMIRSGLDLPSMLGLYREKYSIEDISHVLYGLSYFDDADREELPFMLWDVEWESVRATIRTSVEELAR